MRYYYVGGLLKSRCLQLNKRQCKSKVVVRMLTMSWSKRISAISRHEKGKSDQDRFPMNSDSFGIELVGRHIDDKTHQAITTP